ncbi:fimbrial protein [Achromobacter xylosoxidans]|uniref:fimbrial protein n=1 Tax=Alcaligenes xylosoxydans xylosoxydans TaxID=85698 RepID=UPI000B4920C8|nr:fimbrial protein [Achromobacter xylosoxidans]
MNKNTLAKFALLATAAAVSQAALAEDGRIQFNGEIVDAPCSVSPSATNLVVPLGKVSRASMDGAAGKHSTPAQFEIQLTDCSASAKGASVTFSGTPDSISNDVLAISNSGGLTANATGVAVEIRDALHAKIALGSASPKYFLGLGTNNLKFEAAYVSTGASVTPGPANATAQFTVNYN